MVAEDQQSKLEDNSMLAEINLPNAIDVFLVHAFFYKHCNFLAEAHFLLRYHEKEGSKFA